MHAQLFTEGRVVFQAQDFFDPYAPFEVPGVGTVKEPALFLVRAVAHNWPDAQATECVPSPSPISGH